MLARSCRLTRAQTVSRATTIRYRFPHSNNIVVSNSSRQLGNAAVLAVKTLPNDSGIFNQALILVPSRNGCTICRRSFKTE